MSNSQHLPLYLKIYQLTKFLYEMVRNLPKQYKYALGKDILELSWKCQDLVLEANALSHKEKYPKILELSTVFDRLKIRLRMAQEINLISKKQFVHIQTYYAKEIGEMVGGWLKWSQYPDE
ncbi:MAG: four helix bundle protein [Candidatus Paceibacterota bacterium]